MNDRFKFRAYNKELRKMYEVDSICPYEDNHTKGGEVFLKGIQYNSFYFPEEVEVMQCTGLKDKNGKLIYEGDIIKIPEDWDIYGQFAGEVREVYYNEGFRLKPKWDKNRRGNWLEDTKDFEVIGNIYENKELLEEQ